MKKYSCLLLLMLAICANSSFAQEIIRLTEKDQESDTFINRRNVDINSRLIFKLDRNNLLARLGADTSAGLPTDIDKILAILKGALLKKQEWMDAFEKAATEYEKGNKAEIEKFISRYAILATEILSILEADDKLMQYFEQDESLNIWVQLANALNRRIKEIEQEILTSSRYSDIRVQMGGWLIHNNQRSPLHFDGLDTNPLGEFYEVERWQFAPTPEQIKELEELQKLAKTDELKEADFSDIIRSKYVSAFIDELKERLQNGLEDFKKKAEEVASSLGISAVKTDIETLITEGKTLIDLAKTKIQFYATLQSNPQFSLTSFITTLTQDISTFNAKQKQVHGLFGKLKIDLSAASAAIKSTINDAGLNPLIDSSIAALKESILGEEGLNLLASDPIGDLTLEFSDKVLSLSLKDIPEEPSTDLRYAGFRVPGDKVVVKLVITKGEAKTRIYQETKDVTLYRILPHIETTVGIIFAHPLAETSIQKEFQMAPYYNVLFKGIFGMSKKWKRRASLPNTILDLSFGLHVSSPDFDKDDVPELGVGLVASTLKDYLQFGWAYNIFHGTPYVFFGIRLPIPSMNFSANGSSSVPATPGD